MANLTDLAPKSTRATMGKQIAEMEDEDMPPPKKAAKKDDDRPAGMSPKAYQDVAGKWHEPGSMK